MKLCRTQLLTAGLGALALTASSAAIASASTVPTPSPAAARSTAVPAAAHSEPDNERCELHLPAIVTGTPTVKPGAVSGAGVWHDGAGWHLRVTHPGTAAVTFTGTIRSGQPISAKGFQLEPGDTWKLSNGGRTLTFAFTNHGGLDGLDFTDKCAIVTSFNLQRGGHELSPVQVYLGARGGHPTSNPFTIQRHR